MRYKVLIMFFTFVLLLFGIAYYFNIFDYFKLKKLKLKQKIFIAQLHPKFRVKFVKFISDVEKLTGYDVYLTSGYRSFEKQIELNLENSSNSKAGYSYHNYGLAIDLNLVKDGVFKLVKSSNKQEWIDSGILAIALNNGLRWGGNFLTYYDPVHFDFGDNYSIAELRLRVKNQFGTVGSSAIGNEVYLA